MDWSYIAAEAIPSVFAAVAATLSAFASHQAKKQSKHAADTTEAVKAQVVNLTIEVNHRLSEYLVATRVSGEIAGHAAGVHDERMRQEATLADRIGEKLTPAVAAAVVEELKK